MGASTCPACGAAYNGGEHELRAGDDGGMVVVCLASERGDRDRDRDRVRVRT